MGTTGISLFYPLEREDMKKLQFLEQVISSKLKEEIAGVSRIWS